MKLLILSDANSIHTQKWAFSLKKEGINVRLFSLFKPNDVNAKKYSNFGIEVNSVDLKPKLKKLRYPNIGKLIYISSFPLLKKIIKSFSPKIIHAHYASSYGILGLLCKFKPFIVSVWGSDIYDFPNYNILNKWVLNKVINSADQICSTSKAMQQIVSNNFNRDDSHLVPFGVDTNEFRPSLNNSKLFTVGTIKSIESHNGIDCLIDAANILVNDWKYTKIHFLIIGEGSLLKEMKQKCKKLKIEKNFKFTGYILHENIVEYFQKLSIFVAVSTRESFGVSILEAAACGIPAITSNVGGLPEVNNDQESGFLIPPKNAKLLAQKILKLYKDEELRKNMGNNARFNVVNNFDWQKNIIKMKNIYNYYK